MGDGLDEDDHGARSQATRMRSAGQFPGEFAMAARRGDAVLQRPGLPKIAPRRQHRSVGDKLLRWVNVAAPLVLATVLLGAAWPLDAQSPAKPAQAWLVGVLRSVSVEQQWRMYAPNPARTHTKAYLMAVDGGGEEERPLEEAVRSDADTGRVWAWRRRRVDFWRYRVVAVHTDRPSPNRRWYLRGACVREARGGEAPRILRLYGERVRLRHPEQVRRGKSVLGRPRRKLIEAIACKMGRARMMIEEDRGRDAHP